MSQKIIKSIAVLCSVFAGSAIYEIIKTNVFSVNDMPENLLIIIPVILCAGALIFLISNSDGILPKKYKRIIFLTMAAVFTVTGILITPYAPCHDSFDLHNIIVSMLNGSPDISQKTYMDFWVNNKLTIYFYILPAMIFKSASLGVRVTNGIFLIGIIICISKCIHKLSGKDNFAESTLILSLFSPYMLLSGPYIYLPSIFLTSLAMATRLNNKIRYKIAFYLCSSLLFILRPTALGGIIVIILCEAAAKYRSHSDLLRLFASVVLIFCTGISSKTIMGELLYRAGLHPVPGLDSAAGIWALDIGTRSEGENTGKCLRTPYIKRDNSDDIQNAFFDLWSAYSAYEEHGGGDRAALKYAKENAEKLLVRRIMHTPALTHLENLKYKSVNFFKNYYAPYYYRANLTQKNTDITLNNDKRYFSYMDIILMLFFLSIIINCVKLMIGKGLDYVALTSAGAVAVNMVLILLTEVSKKYMFDFYVPMIICIISVFSGNAPNRRLPLKRVILPMCVILFVFALFESQCRTKIMKGAEISLTEEKGDTETLIVNFAKPCEEGYILATYDEQYIDISDWKWLRLIVPRDSYKPLTLIEPDGDTIYFSAQRIE